MVVGWERGRLDHENVGATHVFLDLDENLHVGEAPDHGFCERQLEIGRNPFASAGLELPATSLIAPFLPDIPKSSPSLGHKRRGHNKAGRARQYGWKSLSRLLAERMNRGLAAGRRER